MTVGVGVAVGVGETLVGVAEEVGVGLGDGDELQPLRSKATTTVEATKNLEFRDFFMLQIYLVLP